MSTNRISRRLISDRLKELAKQICNSEPPLPHPDGERAIEPMERAEKLALLLWDHALGSTRFVEDKKGNFAFKWCPAEPWAIQLVLERTEGKVSAAVQETEEPLRGGNEISGPILGKLNDAAALATKPN